jgi:hypothetical protein
MLGAMHLLHLFSKASVTAFVVPFLYFDRYIVELGIFILGTMWLLYSKGYFRWLAYGLLFIFMVIYGAQLMSLAYGGEFIPPVAFENISFIFLLINQVTISCILLGIIAYIAILVCFEKVFTARPSFRSMVIISGWVLAIIFISSRGSFLDSYSDSRKK